MTTKTCTSLSTFVTLRRTPDVPLYGLILMKSIEQSVAQGEAKYKDRHYSVHSEGSERAIKMGCPHEIFSIYLGNNTAIIFGCSFRIKNLLDS